MTDWRLDEKTNRKRVPFVYMFGGHSRGASNAKADNSIKRMQMAEFVHTVERLALEAGQSSCDEPQPWDEPCLPADRNFEGATENFNAERAGSVRTSDYMGSAPFQPEREGFEYKKKNAVIVVARIAIDKVESVQHGNPVLVSLVIANEFGRVICVRGPDNKMVNYHVPVGTEMLEATCDQRDLRRKLINFMGRDGFLVGFNLNWLLTALNFVVPAFRVVDLAIEPAYQRLVQQLAGPDPNYEGLFNVPQRVGFDRRWPAVLFERGIQYYEAKSDSIYLEAYYTASIWQIVSKYIIGSRSRPDVFRLKAAYVVGYGDYVEEEEAAWLREPVDYCTRFARDPNPQGRTVTVTSLAIAKPSDLFEQCGDVPDPCPSFALHQSDEQVMDVVNACVRLSEFKLDMADTPEFPSPDPSVYATRSQVAVEMMMASQRVTVDANLAASWINGHDEFSPAHLRHSNAKSPLVRDSEKAKRLLSCYIGIGSEMAYALQDIGHDLLDDAIEVVMQPTEMAQGALELTTIASTTSTASAASASGVQTAKEHRGRSSTRGRAHRSASRRRSRRRRRALRRRRATKIRLRRRRKWRPDRTRRSSRGRVARKCAAARDIILRRRRKGSLLIRASRPARRSDRAPHSFLSNVRI